jgi:hypothetical protein
MVAWKGNGHQHRIRRAWVVSSDWLAIIFRSPASRETETDNERYIFEEDEEYLDPMAIMVQKSKGHLLYAFENLAISGRIGKSG